MKVVTGIFSDAGRVEQSVDALKSHGIDTDHIEVVSKPKQKRKNNLPEDSIYDRNLGMTNGLMFGLSTQDTGMFGLTTLSQAIGSMSFGRTLDDVSGLFSNTGWTEDIREDYKRRIDSGETLLSVYTEQKDYREIEDVLKKNGAINTGIY